MSTHTPGPWEATLRGKKWIVGARAALGGKGTAAQLSVLWYVAEGRPQHDNTAEGNARLIAAAPTLLAALKGFVNLTNDDLDDDQCAAWDAAVEAIAKAEGGSVSGIQEDGKTTEERKTKISIRA